MAGAGIAGGLTNFILDKYAKQSDTAGGVGKASSSLPWWAYPFIGVVATFVVPLFLSLVQSNLFDNLFAADTLPPKLVFIYGGFCIVAAISSRPFLQTISDKILALAKHIKETDDRQRKTEDKVEELVENQEQPDEPPPAPPAATQSAVGNITPTLSDEEIRILQALQAKPYRRRTLAGVRTDSNVETQRALQLLGKLKSDGFVIDRTSVKSGNLLYEMTASGADILHRLSSK